MWRVTLKRFSYITEIDKCATMKMEFEFDKLTEAVSFLEIVTTHSDIKDFDMKYEAKVEVEQMITYEQLEKANDTIKTTDIKGKDYAEVNQRVKAFRMVFPNGRIVTDIVSLENGVCVMKTTVYDEEGNVLASGTAYETEGSSFINKTSYIENCETSAVGRALGFAGFGIDTSIRSAEEHENAEIQQNMLKAEDTAKQKIPEVKIAALKERCKNDGVVEKTLCELYKVKSFEDLTERQFLNIHEHWDKIKAK